MDTATIVKIITEVIIPVCAAIITYIIVPWLKAKIGNERLQTIQTWAWNAVEAAEKIFPAGANTEKYEYAVNFLQAQAEKHGIALTSEEITTLIEAVVNSLPKTHEEAV